MTLCDILRTKGRDVRTVGPNATLDEVVDALVEFNIGSLIVCEAIARGADTRMIGIITERDVLRAQAHNRVPLRAMRVASTMSGNLVTASRDDPIERAMQLMTHHRIRHLPVVCDEQLLGVVSIGDLVKTHHDQLEMENYYMGTYIRGEGGEIAVPLVADRPPFMMG